MSRKNRERLAGGHVPNSCCTVIGSRDDTRPIWAEDCSVDETGVPSKHREVAPGDGVPDAGGPVRAGGDDELSVRAESGEIDLRLVTPQRRGLLA